MLHSLHPASFIDPSRILAVDGCNTNRLYCVNDQNYVTCFIFEQINEK